jgi:hypothetical protein
MGESGILRIVSVLEFDPIPSNEIREFPKTPPLDPDDTERCFLCGVWFPKGKRAEHREVCVP